MSIIISNINIVFINHVNLYCLPHEKFILTKDERELVEYTRDKMWNSLKTHGLNIEPMFYNADMILEKLTSANDNLDNTGFVILKIKLKSFDIRMCFLGVNDDYKIINYSNSIYHFYYNNNEITIGLETNPILISKLSSSLKRFIISFKFLIYFIYRQIKYKFYIRRHNHFPFGQSHFIRLWKQKYSLHMLKMLNILINKL